MGSPELKPTQGKRSTAFNFLLEEEYNSKPKSKYTRDNYGQYVTDLSCGDKRLEEDRVAYVEAEKAAKAELRSKTDNNSTVATRTQISDKDRELLSSFTQEEKDELLKAALNHKVRMDEILTQLD